MSKLTPQYKLRKFQEDIAKFVDVPGVLIGDDMGAGKTVEALDLDRRKRLNAPRLAKTLIISPLNVLGNWEDHLEWMLPDMRIALINTKDRSGFLKAVEQGKHDYFACHWQSLRLMPELANYTWFHVVADEVHSAKNRKAAQTQALKKIPTWNKLGLSGTPAETRPDDLWSILNWLYPKTFRSYWKFYKQFVSFDQIENPQTGATYRKVNGVQNVEQLHYAMKSFYIRRRLEDVVADMPPKIYSHIWVDLTPTQRRVYNQMKSEMLAWVGEQQDKALAAAIAIAQLQRLQQLAVAHADIETKTVRKRTTEEQRRHYLQEHPEAKQAPAWQEVPKQIVHSIEPSAKLDAVMQILEDNPGKRLVVFSQFRGPIFMLARRLQEAKISYCCLIGGMKDEDKRQTVRDFSNGKYQVFLSTLTAGGVGIDGLQRTCNTMIFLDRGWSPSANRQAEGRLYRTGQSLPVHVIDIMARNTVDFGRHQRWQQSWTWLQQILGDTTLDYQKANQRNES